MYNYVATLQHMNPLSKGHEIINLDRPFIGHHCYALSECEPSLGVEKIFKKYINFSLLTQKLPPLGMGSYEIYNFLSPYTKNATYQIWLRLALRFLRRRCQRTTHDDILRPIAIGHLSDSGDPKIGHACTCNKIDKYCR